VYCAGQHRVRTTEPAEAENSQLVSLHPVDSSVQPPPVNRWQSIRNYVLRGLWLVIALIVVVLIFGWCTGYAEMVYDQHFGAEQETGGYCWDHGDPHPHHLGHRVPNDHVCKRDDLADAARRRFERAADVTPYQNDLSASSVTRLVKASIVGGLSANDHTSCAVLEIRGSTALVDCTKGRWYVTRQGNVFFADDAAKSLQLAR
jgi:hypothetical protein